MHTSTIQLFILILPASESCELFPEERSPAHSKSIKVRPSISQRAPPTPYHGTATETYSRIFARGLRGCYIYNCINFELCCGRSKSHIIYAKAAGWEQQPLDLVQRMEAVQTLARAHRGGVVR